MPRRAHQKAAVASLPAVAAWYEIESHGEGYGAVFKATKDIVLCDERRLMTRASKGVKHKE